MKVTHAIEIHEILSVLGDPTRLRILKMLKEGHETCKDIDGYLGIHVTDITKSVKVSQPAVSKHLAKLRDIGIVSANRQGQRTFYRRDESMIALVKAALAEL